MDNNSLMDFSPKATMRCCGSNHYYFYAYILPGSLLGLCGL